MTIIKNQTFKRKLFIFGIILGGLIVRYLCRDVLSNDMRYFLLPWFEKMITMDLKTALTTQVGNYNLLYQNLIYCMTRLHGNPTYLYKMLSVFFDLILAWGVYAWLKILRDEHTAVIGFGCAFLLPTIWINSSAWGQCDSIYASFIIWSLLFLYKKKYMQAFLLLGMAFSFKLQTVFIIPFFVFLIIKDLKKNIKQTLYFLLVPFVLFFTSIPNVIAGRNPLDVIWIYLQQTNEYPESYKNYPSIWAILPIDYNTDKLWTFLVTGVAILLIYLLLSRLKVSEKDTDFLFSAMLLTYTCVLFLPAMHERYGYLYEILLLLFVLAERKCMLSMIGIQMITLKCYYYYLIPIPRNMKLLAFLNVAIYVSLILYLYLKKQGKLKEITLFARIPREAEEDIKRNIRDERGLAVQKGNLKRLLLLVLVFFIVGCYRLGNRNSPETFMDVGTGDGLQGEIVLEFSYKYEFDSIWFFLGGEHGKNLYIYNNEQGAWVDAAGGWKTIQSVYAWNKIEINRDVFQLDLVFNDEKAEIGEIICLTKKGEVVRPKNADEYPELFDEQKTFSNPPTYFDMTMYDEVYHARTANEFLHGFPVYENTHPPLGKIIISIGIALFGMNPFGYRIMSLLFGTMMLPVIYFFAVRITGKDRYGVLAVVLSATEFMHFTLSRIGTIDIFVAFFVLCMYYFMYAFIQEEKNVYLVCCGIASALAVATKWTGVYALFGLALIMFAWMFRKGKEQLDKEQGIKELFNIKGKGSFWIRHIGLCVLLFIVIPIVVYVVSYIPFARVYTDKTLVQNAISNSIMMFKYHRNATKPHPFSSPWYSWLIDWRPLLDSRTMLGSKNSAVATFINPVVCFGGLVSFFYHVYLCLRKKDAPSGYLLLFYLVMLGPWMLITRTVFIYQYFIDTLALILMICNSIRMLRFEKERNVLMLVGGLSIALFVLFFPVISGMVVSRSYVEEILRCMPKWVF